MTIEEANKYRTKTQFVEKAVFVGPYSESSAVMKALGDDGWWITRSGPYTDKVMFPKMDMTRFLFHVEREVADD